MDDTDHTMQDQPDAAATENVGDSTAAAHNEFFFNGSVAECVAKAKADNKVILVSVQGADENSVRLDAETWTSEELASELKDQVIPLRLDAMSQDGGFFRQIYPVVRTPTLYFIGTSGQPIDVMIDFVSAEDLIKRWQEKVLPNKDVVPAPAPVAPAPVAPAPVAPALVAPAPVAPAPVQSMTMPPAVAPVSHAAPVAAQSDASRQKAELLKQKVEEAKKRRAAHEADANKEREIKRREEGQKIQDAKQKHEETQAKISRDKARQEKAKDKAIRDQIRQQIAQDKEERKARMARKSGQSDAGGTSAPMSMTDHSIQQTTTATATAGTSSGAQYDHCDIAVRLTNGQTIKNRFRPDDVLSAVKDFIDETRNDGTMAYTMMTIFPRYTFKDSDNKFTLKDLNLLPSAVIHITTLESICAGGGGGGGGGSRNSGGWFDSVSTIASYLNPFNYFVGVPGQPGPDAPTDLRPEATTARTSTGPSETRRSGGGMQLPQQNARSGNLHTLRMQQEASEGKNEYWNGNSTAFAPDDKKD
eukprot:GFYU01002144.1.p1 GENE.GFYU01002144.1~~GFYU01002144.1.p1  ORF type:complete len:531 (-),score=157.51 GFYU01002144.1:104-1696(-)